MADRASYAYDPVGTGAVSQQHRMEAGQLWRQYVIAGIGTAKRLTYIHPNEGPPMGSKLVGADTGHMMYVSVLAVPI
ncbi:hypothetical protein RR48_01967 [Papilio machaon]|uniref:Uncharacterized protein n=1 Tax=Papilio machaon TaxID=76193 RepID=A0A0N0PEM4_PAPMA|nr:hypothetical protein RR48_01967 [Papilio machaon]